MDPVVCGQAGTGPGTGATTTHAEGCTEEAAEKAADSGEACARRPVRSRGRAGAGARAAGNSDTGGGTGGTGRVLRDRTPRVTVTSEPTERGDRSKHDSRQKGSEPPPRRRRGRPTRLPSKDVVSANKQPAAKKASLRILQPKLPKSGKGRSLPRAPNSIPEKVCKTEPDIDVSLSGVDRVSLKRTEENADVGDPVPASTDDCNDLVSKTETKREKARRRPLKQKAERKDEEKGSDGKNEGSEIKSGSTEMGVKLEEETQEDGERPRKRGRRRKDDKTPQLPKRRKKPPVQYVRCEMEGCGTVLAHPRYLQHHIKYQHLLKKKYVCNHPACGRLFRLQKQLLRHAKHHTDQRDYICEFCARAFKSSHNLAVHRMIHTGEKPIQCEICGFTCRQKASLNWHMKKHDADAFYQFSCSICGKKFEKKDCVVAHKAKSHPEVLIAEALAANAGTLMISAPAEAAPAPPGQEPRGLTPLQQVVLPPPAAQTQAGAPHAQLLPLGSHHAAQIPTLLTLPTPPVDASPAQPQLIQLSALPAPTLATAAAAATVVVADPQATLLTLSSVPASLAPHHMDQLPPGEGILWDRVVVAGDEDVDEMMWEGQRARGAEGIVWEREGEREMLLDGGTGLRTDGLI